MEQTIEYRSKFTKIWLTDLRQSCKGNWTQKRQLIKVFEHLDIYVEKTEHWLVFYAVYKN